MSTLGIPKKGHIASYFQNLKQEIKDEWNYQGDKDIHIVMANVSHDRPYLTIKDRLPTVVRIKELFERPSSKYKQIMYEIKTFSDLITYEFHFEYTSWFLTQYIITIIVNIHDTDVIDVSYFSTTNAIYNIQVDKGVFVWNGSKFVKD